MKSPTLNINCDSWGGKLFAMDTVPPIMENSRLGRENATVLVAEDETGLADLYSAWLSTDYSVRTAYDGEQALNAVDDSTDVVLLDRRMPGLAGDEVLNRIRERDLSCRVAMVTAVEPDFNVVELGFDDYVVKPVSEVNLRDLVDRLLQLAGYDSLLQEYFALTSTKATLEAEKSEAELVDSEEYAALTAQLAELQEQLDDDRAEVVCEDFTALLRDPSNSPVKS